MYAIRSYYGVAATTPLMASCAPATEEEKVKFIRESAERVPAMNFNMSGYAAPKLDKVRIGFVGIGDRGSGAVKRMTYIDGVEIVALCDVRQAAVDGGQKILVITSYSIHYTKLYEEIPG